MKCHQQGSSETKVLPLGRKPGRLEWNEWGRREGWQGWAAAMADHADHRARILFQTQLIGRHWGF